MDPLHITEFASDRYFEKLQQSQQQQREANTAEGPSVPVPPLQSRFILPLRQTKSSEPEEAIIPPSEPKHKKNRFGLSRLLHSKPQQSAAALEPQAPRRLSVGEAAKPGRLVLMDNGVYWVVPRKVLICVFVQGCL